MSATIRLAAAAAAVALTGCANLSTDPREGGFLGGVSGLSSGAYEARVVEREDRLAQLRETQRGLEMERTQLESRKSDAGRQLAAERARVKKLDADIAGLEKKVGTMTTQQGADAQRVGELQSRLAELKRKSAQQTSALDALEGSGLGDAETDLRRSQLEEQRRALQREYDLLMKMQLELAR
ncbi:hypothetical protein [Thauera sp. AutoDN2]|jgi:chromosome segregation ATPase|uniref:hypothetical protein n=1 Tax=Thauera sp. AutoDN2 TaxID=3416051 RepID=UPI002A44675A|nr:hypothetical protein [Thauera sp.]